MGLLLDCVSSWAETLQGESVEELKNLLQRAQVPQDVIEACFVCFKAGLRQGASSLSSNHLCESQSVKHQRSATLPVDGTCLQMFGAASIPGQESVPQPDATRRGTFYPHRHLHDSVAHPGCPHYGGGRLPAVEDKEAASSNTYYTDANPSCELYERLGGWEVLATAVEGMLVRLCADERTRGFLEGSDRQHLLKYFTSFVGSAMCGKLLHHPRYIWRAHRCRIMAGLGPEHVDIMGQALADTLASIGAPQGMIDNATRVLSQARWLFADATAFNDPMGLERKWQRDNPQQAQHGRR